MNITDAFLDQAQHNTALGSRFTARVLTLTADLVTPGNPVMDRMLDWRGDLTARGAAVPLRFLAGLHALVLTGDCPALVAVYPPNERPSDDALRAAIATALAEHQPTLMRWLDSPPQTNEVRRSAVMIAAGHWLAAHFDLPFVLSELGASAGLNLMWDKYRLALACGAYGTKGASVRLDPEWRGDCPPMAEVRVIGRRGVDLKPMHPHDPDDALRLLSYLWPDQQKRVERTHAAIELCDAVVDQGDAAAWLEARLDEPHPGALHLVTNTVAWQYFPQDTKDRCTAALAAAGARASETAPLAHLSMEADKSGKEGAAIHLTIWPGGEVIDLGRVDFHGRWVDWTAP